MKKVICMLMALIMCMSICAYAANETSSSTRVEYTGSREPGGEGGSSETMGEYYEITVPALMSPGETKEVSLDGYWPANRKISVTADEKVTMENSVDGSERTLNVSFSGITEPGSNTEEISLTSSVSVQEMDDVIFGSWSGIFTYTISMTTIGA